MEQVKGVLRTLGDSTVHNSPNGFSSVTHYGYIEIGDRILRDIRVFKGMDGKLSHALADEITLYVKSGYVYGFTGADGRIFVSENGASAFETCLYAGFGICAIPLFGLGLLVLAQAWEIKTLWRVRKAAMSLPNAIPI